jgi:hypothetical protein
MAPEPVDTQYHQRPTARDDAVPQGSPSANGGGAGGAQVPDPGFTNTQRVDSLDSDDGRQLPTGEAAGSGHSVSKRDHLHDKVGQRSSRHAIAALE